MPHSRDLTSLDLDDLVPGYHEIARGALLVGACGYACFAFLHVMLLPPGLREPLAIIAGTSALILAALRIALRQRPLPRGVSRWAMLSVVFFIWFNSAAHLWLSADPMQSTNLALVLIAAGIVLIGRTEFLITAAATAAAWAVPYVLSHGGGPWIHYFIHLAEAAVLSAATFEWKRIALVRNYHLRLQEQGARREAERNLRRAQESDAILRESEERFRTLFALAPVGIALNRLEDGRFLLGSSALYEMCGYSEQEFARLTYWDITPKEYDSEEARQLELLYTQGRYGPYEKEYIRKNGERFPVLLNGRRLTDASGQDLILSVIQDISMQKANETALATARDAAESANVAKSRFLATMSHELRTPLNAILGFSEIIASETLGPSSSPQYVEYARIINQSGAHLLSLISDILDLSKIEAGRHELRPEPLDVREAVAEALSVVAAKRFDEPGPVPVSLCARDVPLLVADRRAVTQMIVNLVSNAVKFTPVDGKVTVEARLDAGELVIRVSDTGIGIAQQDIPKALAPFSQVDDDNARRQGGTGLGLSIAKALIELHGGALALESELGKGTIATLKFPHAQKTSTAAA